MKEYDYNDESTKLCLLCKHYHDVDCKMGDDHARGYCCHPVATLPRMSVQYLQGAFPWDCLCRGHNPEFPCVYRNSTGYVEGSCRMLGDDGKTGSICPYGVRAATCGSGTGFAKIGHLGLCDEDAQRWTGCPGYEREDDVRIEKMLRDRKLNKTENDSVRKKREDFLVKLGISTRNRAHSFYCKTTALDLLSKIEPGLPNKLSDMGHAAHYLLEWVAESLSASVVYRSIKHGGYTIETWFHHGVLEKLVSEAEAKARESFLDKGKKGQKGKGRAHDKQK